MSANAASHPDKGQAAVPSPPPPPLPPTPSSLSIILLRACSIISSLRLRSVSCLDSLLPAQPTPVELIDDVTGGPSARSFPFTLALTRDCKLYRVIRSISVLGGFGVLVFAEEVEGAANVMGGWKVGGAWKMYVSCAVPPV